MKITWIYNWFWFFLKKRIWKSSWNYFRFYFSLYRNMTMTWICFWFWCFWKSNMNTELNLLLILLFFIQKYENVFIYFSFWFILKRNMKNSWIFFRFYFFLYRKMKMSWIYFRIWFFLKTRYEKTTEFTLDFASFNIQIWKWSEFNFKFYSL